MKMNADNLSNICRVCLEESSKLYPLEGHIANVDVYISTMISYCTSIEVVVAEDLPKGVCVSCFKIIRIAYNFIKEFKETDCKLLAERELNASNTEVKSELHGVEVRVEESEINDNLDNSYGAECFIPEENITITYVNEENQSPENESTVPKLPLENNEQICADDNEIILKTKDNSSEKLPTGQSLYKYDCPICLEISFGDFNKGLVRHLHRCHRNYLFKCDKCSLETVLTVDLYIEHYSKTHLYQCHICNRKLRTRNSFSTHLKSHTRGKYLRCPYQNCNKSFQSKLGLKKHLHTHSNIVKYICSICGKKFVTYGTFRYHIKTHDGTRSHLCNVCGRAFLQSVHLKYHMWRHTGIKQFRCADCGRSYTSVTQLKKHRRKYCGSGRISEKLNS